jgi:uncharacterized membrane protein YccC
MTRRSADPAHRFALRMTCLVIGLVIAGVVGWFVVPDFWKYVCAGGFGLVLLFGTIYELFRSDYYHRGEP